MTTEGRVIGAERSEMQIIRNFIGQADNADHPQKKKYGRVELVGPFSVRDGEDNYQLYLIRPASSSQSDFINLLFDRPLLLLIVTMLVSTPLLLWLAWSLSLIHIFAGICWGIKKAEEIRLILLTKCALSMPDAARTPYPAYKSLQIQ